MMMIGLNATRYFVTSIYRVFRKNSNFLVGGHKNILCANETTK